VGKPGERIAYLPPRAARARKLILRSQLGLPWMLAALAFAALILVAGVLLLAQSGRPGAPWVRVGPADTFPSGAVTQAGRLDGDAVVVDRRGGVVRAFRVLAADCDVVADGEGFARPCTTESWAADGAPAEGSGTALTPLPAQLARGDLYVNPGP
jgi:hypothetical protein